MLISYKKLLEDKNYYHLIYQSSIKDPASFWDYFLTDFVWHIPPKKSYNSVSDKWLENGEASVCYNCVDRHAFANPNKNAIVWYGDSPGERRTVTYHELYELVLRISFLLKSHGIRKNDIVGIYMPMVPEAIAAMFACSRLGALHLVVFAGFSSEALSYRLKTAGVKILITIHSFSRGGKKIDILAKAQIAIESIDNQCKLLNLSDCLTNDIPLDDSLVYQNNSDELFVLYTSGSTGNPKPIVHCALSYLLYVAVTFKVVFGISDDDVYFCTSDIGWITGHSYIAYGPFFYGLTSVIFEGTPVYPTANRYWEIIENEKVNIFYSTPTSIRSLQGYDEAFINKYDLASLRVLGSVGEYLNTAAWKWFFEVVGRKRCPIMDTWWQTETGGIILAPFRDLNQKPSVVGRPFFGTKLSIVDSNINSVIKEPNLSGLLVITNSWPGKFVRILDRPLPTSYSDNFSTADGAIYTEDYDVKIIGRLDDVVNVAGRRLGAAEFECIINKVLGIKESAVVAVDHDLKGQAPFAFVVLNEINNCAHNESIINAISKAIRAGIGAIASVDYILFVADLPKTRSGKILRGVLKHIANRKNYTSLDVSSVYNPEVIKVIESDMNKYFSH